MFFILFGMWGVRHLSLKIGRDAIKIMGEIPHLIPNQTENIMHIHYTVLKSVCSIVVFQPDWMIVSKNDDKNHKNRHAYLGVDK